MTSTAVTKTLTAEDIAKAIPSRKKTITQDIVDIVNRSTAEPEFQGETLLQTAATYEGVLKRNRVSIQEYLNAIRFCAYIITEESNFVEAYSRVFIDRSFVSERVGMTSGSLGYRELSSAASRYRKSRLVVDILTMSQVPLSMMFAGYQYKAIGVLANLMETAYRDQDKIAAAKELLAATKSDTTKIALEVGPSEGAVSMQMQLEKQLSEVAAGQLRLLNAGFDIVDVQRTGVNLAVVEGEE